MINKIYHLNCATLKPISGKVICHCLLLDTSDGLVLIDTGIGTKDIQNPKNRLDWIFRLFIHPALEINETAYHQIKKLGLNPDDVKTIVFTHLHEDHAGGLSDFPNATIIVSKTEYDNVVASKKVGMGYSRKQLKGDFNWKPITFKNTTWNEFLVEEVCENISLVEMRGHTKGHCGVLIQHNDQWLLHCGDSYYIRNSLKYGFNKTPIQFKLLQNLIEGDKRARLETERKVYNLFNKNLPNLNMFCSHDSKELELYSKKN